MIYLRLYWEFFKTGLFSVGGGMATVPFIQNMGASFDWFTPAQLADIIAVAESTPGAFGINMATYVGYSVGLAQGGAPLWGVLGGLIASLGLITPSIIVILIVARVLEKFRKNRYVEAAFYGLRPASVGMIAAAGLSIVLMSFCGISSVLEIDANVAVDWRHLVLAAIILVATRWIPKVKKLHAIWFILFSAVAGVVFGL